MVEAVDDMEGVKLSGTIDIDVGTDLEEGNTWFLDFPEHESETFELYLQCVREKTMTVEIVESPEEYESAEERVKLAKVYLFAMYIGDPGAMDMITEALLQSIWEMRGGRQWFPPHPDLVDII
ncbi:hypothetical protein G6514_000455 [Epicoccum nigrum]|nr:hypothetical protein G6514_000455 [Epicoccum nigrum]